MKTKLKEFAFAVIVALVAVAAFAEVSQNEKRQDEETATEADAEALTEKESSISSTALLPSESVTPSVLKPIFEKERWKAEEVKGGLKLKDPRSSRVIAVEWSPDKELISLVMWYKFDDFVFKRQKIDLANRTNSEVMLTRASVDEEGDLRFDYWMSYSSGISGDQVLSALRNFERTTEAALRIKDKRDIVK